MTLFPFRQLLSVILLAALVAGIDSFVPRVATGNEGGPEVASSESRPWILVSLSPKRCSRGCRNLFAAVKALSGNSNGKILPFSEVSLDLIQQLQPEFVILSPQGTPWCRYSGSTGINLQNFLWSLPYVAEELNVPILGVCGGHQALALAFGGEVGPIRAGEQECLPYNEDRQGGYVPLTKELPDPIFRGLGSTLRILQDHYDEVKIMPPGFVLLASEKKSPLQIIRHPSLPVYGIQGHVERLITKYPDGWVLIRNFITIARTYNRTVRDASGNRPRQRMTLRK